MKLKLKLKKETRVEFMLYVMFVLFMVLALFLAKATRDFNDESSMIKRHQNLQNETTNDMQERITTLEEVVVLQSQIILDLNKQQPFPENSQVIPEPEKVKVEQEDPNLKSFWPVAVAGTLEIFRTIVNPMHILSPR